MNRMTPSTIRAGAVTAAVRLMVFGNACPIIPPPAATRTRKKVPSSSENNRRHSCDGSAKSSTARSRPSASDTRRCLRLLRFGWSAPAAGLSMMVTPERRGTSPARPPGTYRRDADGIARSSRRSPMLGRSSTAPNAGSRARRNLLRRHAGRSRLRGQ